MSNILEKLAGNKTIANLAFKQIRKYIQDEKITMICIYIDNTGNIAAKQYETPVAVLKQEDAERLMRYSNEIDSIRNTEKALIEEIQRLKLQENELQETVSTLNNLLNQSDGKPE